MRLIRFISTGANWKHIALISVVVMVSLYTLSFFQFIPKWDSVRGYLPYRFFISDYVSDGQLPLWNPFQRLGYPGYCDLQSGVWYPVLWLLMLFGQYDITSLIVEVVGCFLIAGWGMYTLSNWMVGCKRTAAILGISYALSGFMVGSAQLMVFLIGVAWLPWILWSLLRLLEDGSLRYALWLALFLMCNITGASPAFTIILIYIIPAVSILSVWKKYKVKGYFLLLLKSSSIGFFALIILLLPFLQSFIDFYPYFNRTGKLAYEDMIINPFVWADYISFLFPYSVISTGEMFEVTDLSLRNGYIGLVCFFFLVLSITCRKYWSRWHAGLIVGCLISLWLALGDFSGIYRIAYHFPAFGLFRHPAFFRGYAMLCMLLLSGFAIKRIIAENYISRSAINLFLTFVFIASASAYWAWRHTSWESIRRSLHEIYTRFEFPAAGFESQLFLNSIILLLLAFLAVILRAAFKLNVYYLLLAFTAADLFIQTQLSAPTTLHHGIGYAQTKDYFHALEALPDHDQRFNGVALNELDESVGLIQTAGLDRNLSTFNRTISAVGENPMRFRAFDEARNNGQLQWVLQNPLFYFPDKICNVTDSLCAGCLFNTPASADEIGDSVLIQNPQVEYNAYSVYVENPNAKSRLLLLNVNYHHLWKADFNGAELAVIHANDLVMGVRIPPQSKGEVRFKYQSPFLFAAWLISVATLIILLLVLLRTPQNATAHAVK